MKKKINTIVGSIGAFVGVFVFITYIPQIIANLNGMKGQPHQPLTAALSCLIWVIYGWTKEPKKDYILIIPNAFGVVLGFITFSYHLTPFDNVPYSKGKFQITSNDIQSFHIAFIN